MSKINKNITLFSIYFVALLVLYKAIQIGFLLADSNKVTTCTNTRFDLIQWLFFSAICGLASNLYTLINIINMHYVIISILNYTYSIHNIENIRIYKILSLLSLIFNITIVITGCTLCFFVCNNIYPIRMAYISKVSIFIDLFSCIAIISTTYFRKKLINYINKNIMLGGDLEFDYNAIH